MSVGEMLKHGKAEGFYSVILLIDFLVNEKQVVSLSDDINTLDRYTNPKHRDKMNGHLREYIEKMKELKK